MAGKENPNQQDELRQILFQDESPYQGGNLFDGEESYPASNRGGPLYPGGTRGSGEAPDPRREPHRRPVPPGRPRGRISQNRMRQFERPAAPPPRGRAPVQETPERYAPPSNRAVAGAGQESYVPPPRRSSAASWLLVVLVAVLLVAAGVLVFLLATGGLGPKRDAPAAAPALPAGSALLAQTQDAGDAYVAETIFIGDSNFERLREYSLVDPSTVAAKTGIGAAAITGDAFINVTGQENALTIAETMKAVQPKRMLVMMGANDIPNMTAEDFTRVYAASLKELRAAAPGASIVVASVPPVAAGMDGQSLNASAVRQFNQVLLDMCETEGFAYLDVYSALENQSGYLPDDATEDGFHLSQAALQTLLECYRTHAFNP